MTENRESQLTITGVVSSRHLSGCETVDILHYGGICIRVPMTTKENDNDDSCSSRNCSIRASTSECPLFHRRRDVYIRRVMRH